MTFNDIFKSSFLENQSNLSAVSIGLTLLVAFALGVFIFQIYKKTYQSVIYTKSFSLSLVMMTMITALVIMAVTANVVLSLGMVGALSIVRFRAAIKDPMDIVFMFFSITAGIVTGAGFYLLALVGTFVIGMIIYGFSHYTTSDKPFLLLISYTNAEAEKLLLDKIKSNISQYTVKSKTVSKGLVELTVELRIKEGELELINTLNAIPSVSSAMLISSSEYSN